LLLLGFPFINPILAVVAFPTMLIGCALIAISTGLPVPTNLAVGITGLLVFLFGLM